MMADIDTNDGLQKSVCENGRFQNPWPTWSTPKFRDLLRFIFTDKDKSQIPSQEVKRFVFTTISNVNPYFDNWPVGAEQNVANTKANI